MSPHASFDLRSSQRSGIRWGDRDREPRHTIEGWGVIVWSELSIRAHRPAAGNLGSTARVEGKSLITALRGTQAAPLPSLVW